MFNGNRLLKKDFKEKYVESNFIVMKIDVLVKCEVEFMMDSFKFMCVLKEMENIYI